MIVEDLAVLATPVDKLELLPGNPRVGDVDAVARSLAAFGQRKPIVAKRDGTVIAGNHTLQAARSLGWDSIAVVWVDDDDTTAKAYALADNRTAELGGYDDALLASLVGEVAELDPELLGATGWTEQDLALLVDGLEPARLELAGDPDDVPESAPAKTIPGDVWLLGPHRLLCGDATVPTDVERVMAGDRADLVWTDPPYGVEVVGGSRQYNTEGRRARGGLEIMNDRLAPDALHELLTSAFTAAFAACRPGAVWFVASPPGPLFLRFAQVLADLDIWHQTIAWVKDSLVLGRSDYHYRYEPLFFGWVPGAAHHPTPDRLQDTVWEIPRPKRSKEHPTMKPVALVERAITNHTNRRALVLDPFAGSGTTLIAAEITGRRARLVELDPRYCDVICARYQMATGNLPVAEATGREHDFLGDVDG